MMNIRSYFGIEKNTWPQMDAAENLYLKAIGQETESDCFAIRTEKPFSRGLTHLMCITEFDLHELFLKTRKDINLYRRMKAYYARLVKNPSAVKLPFLKRKYFTKEEIAQRKLFESLDISLSTNLRAHTKSNPEALQPRLEKRKRCSESSDEVSDTEALQSRLEKRKRSSESIDKASDPGILPLRLEKREDSSDSIEEIFFPESIEELEDFPPKMYTVHSISDTSDNEANTVLFYPC